VQDTADTTEPAGQADDTTTTDAPAAGQADAAATDDDQAQQLLADAMSQGDTAGQSKTGDGKTPTNVWDNPESARKEIEKVRREAANWRTKFRQAEPQLTEYQKWLDSQKTEQQRLAEAKETVERELTTLRSANARLMAAATHNLPPDLIDFLGDGTEEQIDERARVLAERLSVSATPAETAAPKQPRPAPRRPVESLTPGARPADEPSGDPNEAFRQFLNGSRR
jgi:hypothetical protein